MSKPPEMTRKEALAILYKVKDAATGTLYSSQASEEMKLLGTQVHPALKVLTIAVHGKPKANEAGQLCDICYLRYVPLSNPFVYLREDPIACKDLCADCLNQFKAEDKIARLEHWFTREVIVC